ncbi:MAG: hypothetical protein IT572_10010 [Deltaproteobacteria bacterium]|nr:hypothetical protein [Deltaproteobacteria bacterium]
MTPPGRIGSGSNPPMEANLTGGSEAASGEEARPAAPRRRLPSLSAILRPRRNTLSGQTIVVVFNPAARDGRVGGELPQLLEILRNSGANVIPVETVPDLEGRRERIRNAVAEALRGGQRIFVLPVGGDGTIGETVGEALRAAGASFAPGQEAVPGVESPSGRAVFVLVKKGTAADNAVQVRAPSDMRDLPRFIARSVELGFRFPIVDGAEAGTHSMGFLASGYLFGLRQRNRAANPEGMFNQGLLSYLRLIPHAIANRYGLVGVDVTLTRSTVDGREIERETMKGSEVTVTPNRILAFVGGVPGAWGETKVVVLPPGPRGVLALTEYIARGLMTKIGFNLVGPRSRLWTLSARRQWLVNPGEKIEVRATVPDSLAWDLIRTYQDFQIRMGNAPAETRVPPANEPVLVPSQQNGDVIPPRSAFTVHAPNFTITQLAAPNSLAVRLARASWLVRGETPMISDQQLVFNQVPDFEPKVIENAEGRRSVRTPFVSLTRLYSLMRQYRISPERAESLLTAAQGVQNFAQLERLASEGLTIENLERWLQGDAGRQWAQENRDGLRALRERVLRGGPPLATGIAALIGAERLADIVGLDPVRQRELRFAFVVYLSHAASASTQRLWQVTANALLRQPYHLASLRTVRIAGERLGQWTFLERPSYAGALGESALRGLGWEAGFGRTLLRRGVSLATLLPRSAWNMGEGLIFSRIAERLTDGMSESSALRRYAPTAAFFLPDVARVALPSQSLRLLESRPMRLAGRAFAAGFIGDLGFTGIRRLQLGGNATYEMYTDLRAAELRRERGEIGPFSWRNLPRLIAPSISAYIDSHDFLFGSSNEVRNEIQRQDQRQSALLREAIRQELAWLPAALGGSAAEVFGREIVLTPLQRDLRDQLEHCAGRGRLRAGADIDETASYLHRQFRGAIASREEAREHVLKIYAYRLQQAAAQLHGLEIAENNEIRRLFDARGVLRPGQEEPLQAWVGGSTMPFALMASL